MSSPGELEWWGPGTVPAVGAIVWCHFPDHLTPEQPGPKPRPALIFKVRYADNPPANRFMVLVAYGTSKTKVGRRPNDFIIANTVTLDLLRLPQATRFDLDMFVWLPWAKPFFCPRKEETAATPILSVLPADMLNMLSWTMARRENLGLNAAYHGARTVEPPQSE